MESGMSVGSCYVAPERNYMGTVGQNRFKLVCNNGCCFCFFLTTCTTMFFVREEMSMVPTCFVVHSFFRV